MFRRDCFKPNCATTLFNQRDSAVVGTDEQRANGVPVNAGAGQPAADDELAAFAVRRLDPVARPQPGRVGRSEMLANNAFELQICGGREHGLRVDTGPAAW